jgi:hypothetical protein
MGSEKQKPISWSPALHAVGAFLRDAHFLCAMTVPAARPRERARDGCFSRCLTRSHRRETDEGEFRRRIRDDQGARNWCTMRRTLRSASCASGPTLKLVGLRRSSVCIGRSPGSQPLWSTHRRGLPRRKTCMRVMLLCISVRVASGRGTRFARSARIFPQLCARCMCPLRH